jgi:hypothetical protein
MVRRPAAVEGPAWPVWVDHCRPWVSAIRWLELEVNFLALRSRGRPAQADPQLPIEALGATRAMY